MKNSITKPTMAGDVLPQFLNSQFLKKGQGTIYVTMKKNFTKLVVLFAIMLCSLTNMAIAQYCTTPAATRTIAMANSPSTGIGTTSQDPAGDVLYLTGNGNYQGLGVSNPTGYVVLTAGSHITVQGLGVGPGTLIVQAGATITVTGVNRPTPQNLTTTSYYDFSVAAGTIQMCQNSAIEVCGYGQIFQAGQINYTGEAGGKAVIKGQRNGTGAFVISNTGYTNSPNLVIVTEANDPVNYMYQTDINFNGGYATRCNIGGPCTTLPYTVTTTCGEFASQNPTPAAAVGTIDCSKTQLNTAAVAGVAGQKTLIVTVNVTTAGCFTGITASGSGISIANGATQICTSTTGVQQFSIPVNYSGAALGTVNFTVGAAGSCSANLTTSAKSAICNIWTLDCVPTVAPVLQ